MSPRNAKPEELTVSAITTEWLETVVRITYEITTYERYSCLARKHIYPLIGHERMADLVLKDIYKFQATLHERVKGRRTADLILTVLGGSFAYAVKTERITHNIIPFAAFRKGRSPEVEPPSVEHVQALLVTAAETDDPLFALVRVMVYTGMRRGEALGLTWGNVDLDHKRIRVTSSLVKTQGRGMIQKRPKTRKSVRTVVIDEGTVQVLRLLKEMSPTRPQGDDLVFHNDDGSTLKPSTITYRLKRLVRKAGLEEELKGINFHAFRHFHASVLLQSKQNPKAIADRLGHSDVTTLLRIYAHLLPGWGESVSDAFTEFMGE